MNIQWTIMINKWTVGQGKYYLITTTLCPSYLVAQSAMHQQCSKLDNSSCWLSAVFVLRRFTVFLKDRLYRLFTCFISVVRWWWWPRQHSSPCYKKIKSHSHRSTSLFWTSVTLSYTTIRTNISCLSIAPCLTGTTQEYLLSLLMYWKVTNEPRHEKTCLLVLRPTQTGLLSYRD